MLPADHRLGHDPRGIRSCARPPHQLSRSRDSLVAPRPLASRPWLRMTVGALLVVMVLATGSVSAACWYFTDQLVTPDHSAPRFDIAVHDASSKAVELDKTN